MKKLTIAAIVLLALATLIAAPVFGGAGQDQSASGGGAEAQYLRFAWWGNTTRDARTQQVIQLFMQNNAGVTMEGEPTAWDSYWPKLQTQASTQSLPDIMQQDYMYFTDYAQRGLIADMTPYVNSGIIDLSKWADSAVAAGKVDGKLVALNLGVNAWGMVVDPAVLQQAGITIDDTAWTWADFEKYAIEIYQKTGVQTMPPDQFHQIFENIVRQPGGSFFAADNKSLGWGSAGEAAIKNHLDMWLRIKAAGAMFNPEEAFMLNLAMEEMPIVSGKTWNHYNWSNQFVAQQTAAKRSLAYVIFPQVSSGKPAKYGTYLKPSQFISLMTASKNPELAAKFINFFVNSIPANDILLGERGVPVPSDVLASVAAKSTPEQKYVMDYITHVTPYTSPIDPPDATSAGEVRDTIRPILLSFLQQSSDSAKCVSDMVTASNQVLSR
jgi:multiple sugar transport system substrate-binding protein